GEWHFVSAANIDQDLDTDFSFTLKVTDSEGDFVEDSFTVNVADAPVWELTAAGSGDPTRNTVLEGALASYTLDLTSATPLPGVTYTVQLSVNFAWVDPAGDKDNASAADITATGTQNSVLQALADSINAAGVSGITASFTPGNTYVTVSALNPAASSVTFNLPALDDTIFENTEDLGVVITSPSANSTINAAANEVTTNIVNTDAPPNVSLLGVLVINEVGLNASVAQSFKVGGTDYVIPAGLSYIEIKNLSTNASDTSGSKVPTLRLEITDGTDTVYVSLSTLSAMDANNYLVLYENGTWVEYEADGDPKQTGTYTYFNPVTQAETSAAGLNWDSVIPAGTTTSDPIGVSLYQKVDTNLFTVDGFLANGVNIGSDNGTLGDPDNKLTLGNVIWNGASGNLAPASATTLLGSALTQNSQYNGTLGDQYQMALTLGLSSLLPIQFIDDSAAQGVQNSDSTSLIYAREFNPTNINSIGQPGDDNRADQPIQTDSNKESDWTVTYGNTQGRTNQVGTGVNDGGVDSANPQDSADETDPDQAFKDGNLDNSGVDAQFAGQSVLIAGGNDSALTGFRGGDGQDYLYGTTGNDSMFGGTNNDLLFGNSGNDTLSGDAGADLLVDILGQDTLQGGTGDDTLISGSEFKLWSGGGFVDTKTLPGWDVAGSQTALVLDGIALTGFEDILDGGAGNDILIGGLGDDQLIGGLGADLLSGGGGANLLDVSEANQSRDIVQFTGEALDALDADDLIVGFNTANDVIDLSELFDVAAGKTIADYADIDGTALKIDMTGSGGAGGWNTIATFQSAPVGVVTVLYNNNGADDTTGII
ncbi:calcium-binding protein, partial [Mesorhizobium sp. KR9-304]|uniref:calcium-binding protein n=1 Tax=Mesorhizobium sp. KR9-304 TaxID=3156614 RepID=UPI0032B462B8